MSEPGSQLALDLPFDERRGEEDFLVSACNEAAYAAIESWPDWPDPVLTLVGPEGAGKSHLAAIWAARAHAWTRAPREIAADGVPHLVSAGAVLIEDVDRGGVDEAALFHLINAMRQRGGHILMTARAEPAAWGLTTPDLVSRLRRAPVARIAPPDDGLLHALLIKLFVDRQLIVDTRIIDAIARRAERSFAAARAVVDALDQAALAAGRPVTRAMTQAVVDRLTSQEPEDGGG